MSSDPPLAVARVRAIALSGPVSFFMLRQVPRGIPICRTSRPTADDHRLWVYGLLQARASARRPSSWRLDFPDRFTQLGCVPGFVNATFGAIQTIDRDLDGGAKPLIRFLIGKLSANLASIRTEIKAAVLQRILSPRIRLAFITFRLASACQDIATTPIDSILPFRLPDRLCCSADPSYGCRNQGIKN